MNKKGQAAMEFLMTYGWAILAAIIVIGVLAVYFRPSTLTQNSVIVTAPLYGVGVALNTSNIYVEVKNQGGETLTTTSSTLTFNTPSGASCNVATGIGQVSASSNQVLDFSGCSSLSIGNTVNADIKITYMRPGSSLNLTSTGTLSGSVS